MKVLLCFPQADGQTGPAIKYAFEQLGHTVRAVDAKQRPERSYSAALEFKPDLIFCSRTKALAAQIIQIKKAFPGTTTCVWNVDTRYTTEEWSHLFPLIKVIDFYFVAASGLIPEWRKLNKNTYWLPQGLQEEIYKKPTTITEEDKRKYECDVCFCGSVGGSHHSNRGAFLGAIFQAGFKLNLWGNGGRPKIYNEEHNKQAALAKINLCCSGWPINEDCTSVRNYKIMGAGGFVLELYRKGINEIFPANALDCYRTREELLAKIGHWLGHDKERKEIAENGFKWVHEKATYKHRIKAALDYMGDVL